MNINSETKTVRNTVSFGNKNNNNKKKVAGKKLENVEFNFVQFDDLNSNTNQKNGNNETIHSNQSIKDKEKEQKSANYQSLS